MSDGAVPPPPIVGGDDAAHCHDIVLRQQWVARWAAEEAVQERRQGGSRRTSILHGTLLALEELTEDALGLSQSILPGFSQVSREAPRGSAASRALTARERGWQRSCSGRWWAAAPAAWWAARGSGQQSQQLHALENEEEDSEQDVDSHGGLAAKDLSYIVPLAALAPVVSLGHGSMLLAGMVTGHPVMLVIAGVSVPTKLLYTFWGVFMAVSSWSALNRHPREADRTVQRRSCVCLALNAVKYLLLAVGTDFPMMEALTDHVGDNVDLGLLLVPEVLTMPLVVLNVGHIAGQAPSAMRVTLLATATSAALLAAAPLYPNLEVQVACLVGGTLCLFKACHDVSQVLPAKGRAVSLDNQSRAQISADLFVTAWAAYPFMESLCVLGTVSVPTLQKFFMALDLLGTMGVCHLTLRDQAVCNSAARYHQGRRPHERPGG